MNIDALLEDYMKNPKWAGKIFMQDEKTCYIDGLIAGAKAMQENEQLKSQLEKMKCCRNCKYWNVPDDLFNTPCKECEICENCNKWELAE